MDQRAEYLIQILEKIGVPLLAAAGEVSARQGIKASAEAAEQDAQKIAELLARSVQASIEIGKSVDLAAMDDQGESMRLALAALASNAVAGQYKSLGRAPGELDLKRIVTSLQAVLTFSENFTPDPANVARLKQMQAQGQIADAGQIGVQYVLAFLPVVNAIGAFSFGQAEIKAIQDVSNRLMIRAATLKTKLFPNLSGDESKFTELALVRCLAALYASCHEAEVARLAALNEAQRAGAAISVEPVWTAFEMRTAMLEALAPALLGRVGSSSSSSKAPAVPTPPPVQQAPIQPSQPPAFGGSSPLSMFASKPAEAAAPPPPPPPANPPQDEPSSGQQEGGNGGGPMSFFKKGR